MCYVLKIARIVESQFMWQESLQPTSNRNAVSKGILKSVFVHRSSHDTRESTSSNACVPRVGCPCDCTITVVGFLAQTMTTHRCFSVRHRYREKKHLYSSRNFDVRFKSRQSREPFKAMPIFQMTVQRTPPVENRFARVHSTQSFSILFLSRERECLRARERHMFRS